MTLITGEDNIERFRLITLRGALRLEMKGLKRSKGSVSHILKESYGITGSKKKQLEALNHLLGDKGYMKE